MKVLLVCGSYPPLKCGVGDYTSKLAAALSKCAHVEVDVLTTGDLAGADLVDGINVWRCLPDWGIRRLKMAADLIKKIKPDLVHVQYPAQGYSTGLLPRLLPLLIRAVNLKVLQTWHEGCPIRQPVDVFLKAIAAKAVIVVRPDFRRSNLHPWLAWALQTKEFRFIANASSIPRAVLDPRDMVLRRRELLNGQQRLIVHFGFAIPSKGTELVFDIADPRTDYIIVVGEMVDQEYRNRIVALSESDTWRDKSQVQGFLPPEEIAELLALADAVVLPFRKGGGEWNTSIHAATMQGSFVLTTSAVRNGYSESENIYFARIDDVDEMRGALLVNAGSRTAGYEPVSWQSVAEEHLLLYRSMVGKHASAD